MTANLNKPALLVLENGSVYPGFSFGHESDSQGEVCFNTSMAGYQEILTDPSYSRQLITLTYPMIGNYGISPEANESDRIHASGLIVREYVSAPSNHTSRLSLGDFLRENEKPGIEGLDTRQLTLEIRNQGAMRGGIFMGSEYGPEMLEKVLAEPSMNGRDLASSVSAADKYGFGEHQGKEARVAVLDFGVKRNILRLLDRAGFAVDVFPAKTPAEEILSGGYDAFFLSNGPGDPEPLDYAIALTKRLMETGKPMFGICLGHQIIGLARGLATYKLKFGHRGGNQPVMDKDTGRVEITSQNHGFAVQRPQAGEAELRHINLNDGTVEGFTLKEQNIMSVQYHPEACPGPHDSAYLFAEFYRMTLENRVGSRVS